MDDYVFAHLVDQDVSLAHRYLIYIAANARFAGLDGQISHQLNDTSKVTVFGDYVRAELTSGDDNLPRIPPGRLGARYEFTSGAINADIEYIHTFTQDRIASYETTTPDYDIINATLAYRFIMSSTRSLDLYVRGTNLTNELAFVHTSFVRDQSPLRGRNIAVGVRHSF